MQNFSVNLSTIFTEVSFGERFKKAKEFGFDFVEFQFPYSYSLDTIKETLLANEQEMILINLPAGDYANGERGLAIFEDKMDDFKQSVEKGIQYATNLQTSKIHCMSGLLPEGMEYSRAKEVFMENIQYAAGQLSQHQLTLLIEPINNFDVPSYFLSNIHEAAKMIDEINLPNLKLQYDFYHIQRLHGNLLSNFQQYANIIGHVQLADVPGRHEPGTGEIHYRNIFSFLDEIGYDGYIGLEYTPKTTSETSFAWLTNEKRGV